MAATTFDFYREKILLHIENTFFFLYLFHVSKIKNDTNDTNSQSQCSSIFTIKGRYREHFSECVPARPRRRAWYFPCSCHWGPHKCQKRPRIELKETDHVRTMFSLFLSLNTAHVYRKRPSIGLWGLHKCQKRPRTMFSFVLVAQYHTSVSKET